MGCFYHAFDRILQSKNNLLALALSLCVFQNSWCMPWGINTSLEQQVAELKVNTEDKSELSPTDLEDNRLSSGKIIIMLLPEKSTAFFKVDTLCM